MSNENIGDWVLYKNNQFIAFNKPAGIPVQPDKTKDKSLLQLAEIYCKHPVHVIHRIDRPASGVVLMAKNKKALAAVNEQFQTQQIEKIYLAIVQGTPEQDAGRIEHYLRKNGKTKKADLFTEEVENGKKAILHFRVLNKGDRYSLLEIKLNTGRFHQIRAQLASFGCPIKGDVKYGFPRGNSDRSIHLHAWKLTFTHPVSGERTSLTAPIPDNDSLWNILAQGGIDAVGY